MALSLRRTDRTRCVCPGMMNVRLDVAILDESLPVLDSEIVGERETGGPTGLGNGNHHIDVVVGPLLDDLLRKRLSHAQPRLVDRYVVDDRVGSGKVDVLEDAGRIARLVEALAGVDFTSEGDDHRFARLEIAHELETERIERDALRRHHVLEPLCRLPCTKAERGEWRTGPGTPLPRTRRSSPLPRNRPHIAGGRSPPLRKWCSRPV